MKLSELLNKVKVIQVIGNAESKDIEEISIDSRSVRKNSVFFAIHGEKLDGHKFIPEVLSKGIAAVVLQYSQSYPDQMFAHSNCVKIVVEDSRKALAEFANIFYDEPSKKLKLIGITGTKGKTTTAFYVKSVFEKAGYKCGLIGTIANYIGDREVKTMLTTPQSHEVNSLMAQMISEGCAACVMEVSSHALDLHRVDHLEFDIGIFTNITSDHMDYHKNFEHYLASKKMLFDKISSGGKIIINSDDKSAEAISKNSKAEKYFYGKEKNAARLDSTSLIETKRDFRMQNVEYDLDGTRFEIIYGGKEYKLATKLVGHFNAYNAASAFAAGVLSGIKPETAAGGIETTPQVPGRFEVVSKKNKKVIIDYSHTSDSLKQALTAVRHIVKNERPVYTVFGCGGDRDKTKRPVMGNIASEMSDKVFVTSDNPRTENPFEILEQVVGGIKKNNYKVIESREEAIRSSIFESEENAVILVAGKGHENYQEINGVRKHFSDKETAEKYLKEWAK